MPSQVELLALGSDAACRGLSTAARRGMIEHVPRPLPDPPSTVPDVQVDFADGLDPGLWVTSYLEHWTTPDRARARYSQRSDGVALHIEDDQPDWRAADAPLRVSNVQTGSFSGPVGSTRGTHRHRPDGLTVQTAVPTRLLWAPSSGRLDVTVSASPDPGCMFAAWLVGTEHRSARDSGEICVAEIDAPQGDRAWSARTGIKAHDDDRLHAVMTESPLWFDASTPHTWTVVWGEGRTTIGCEGRILHEIVQAPSSPLFLMIDLFEIGPPRGHYPKTAVLHSLSGWGR